MKIEEIKEEFGEKFTFLNDLNQYKVGYRNRNGDDCMFGPQKVWNFIESNISQTRKEVIEEVTKTIKKEWKWAKDNEYPQWNFETILNKIEKIKLHSQTKENGVKKH